MLFVERESDDQFHERENIVQVAHRKLKRENFEKERDEWREH